MRSAFLLAIVSILFFPAVVNAQTAKKTDVETYSAVIKTSEWAGFKYMENINLALAGDQMAIKALLEFSGTVDGAESLQHATTCIELIPFASDDKFGSVISSLKPKLKTVLLERFQLAQGRTKKEELRKPLQEWAPLCWKALNGERVTCNSCMHESGLMKSKPGLQKPAAPLPQSSETGAETGKQ